MGMGIGVECHICGNQMYYDDDGDEIAQQLTFDGEEYLGTATCHECIVNIKRMKIAQQELSNPLNPSN